MMHPQENDVKAIPVSQIIPLQAAKTSDWHGTEKAPFGRRETKGFSRSAQKKAICFEASL
jgi:hypothetical protein